MRSDPRPTVCVEITPLLETHWTGIPVFTRRLIRALTACPEITTTFHCNGLPVHKGDVEEAIRQGSGAVLRAAIDERRGPKPHAADQAAFFLWPSAKKNGGVHTHEASVIHDLSTLFQPELHVQENIDYHLSDIENEIASDERVFCTSESTRLGLCSAFPSARQKAVPLFQYVDWPADFAEMDANLPPIDLGPYAVVLGTLEPRKNLSLVFRALREDALRGSDLSLVVIGRRGWLIDKVLAEIDPRERKRVIFSGFVTEFVKYRLLRHCRFLIFPSVYEGFGIPALEAMSLGKPVMASRSSSLPEIIGDTGILFDPFSEYEFSAALSKMECITVSAHDSARIFSRTTLYTPQRMVTPILDWVLSTN